MPHPEAKYTDKITQRSQSWGGIHSQNNPMVLAPHPEAEHTVKITLRSQSWGGIHSQYRTFMSSERICLVRSHMTAAGQTEWGAKARPGHVAAAWQTGWCSEWVVITNLHIVRKDLSVKVTWQRLGRRDERFWGGGSNKPAYRLGGSVWQGHVTAAWQTGWGSPGHGWSSKPDLNKKCKYLQ